MGLQINNINSLDLLQSSINQAKQTTQLYSSALLSASELSKGLSIAVGNSGFLESYQGVIKLQDSIAEKVNLLADSFKITQDQGQKFSVGVLAPLTSTVANIGLLGAGINKTFLGNNNVGLALQTAKDVSNLCVGVLKEQQGYVLSSLNSITSSKDLNNFVSASDSLRMVSIGLSDVAKSFPLFPGTVEFGSLNILEPSKDNKQETVDYGHEQLDSLLNKIDKKFVEIRLGCWETFGKKGKDYVRQSSSSMRGLVDELLRTLASDEEVINTEYYKTSEEGENKSKPTRKARIYCIMGYDKDKAGRFEKLANGFLDIYNNLSAWDHSPIKNDQFVQGIFVAIEGQLLSILSEYSFNN